MSKAQWTSFGGRSINQPKDAGCCKRCGRDIADDPDVDSEVVRVFGDSHGRLPACNVCVTPRTHLAQFDTVSAAIGEYLNWGWE